MAWKTGTTKTRTAISLLKNLGQKNLDQRTIFAGYPGTVYLFKSAIDQQLKQVYCPRNSVNHYPYPGTDFFNTIRK